MYTLYYTAVVLYIENEVQKKNRLGSEVRKQ